MRSHGDLTGLNKFLARDDWKSSFEEVLGEHFGPAMQAFDLTLWGVAFEDVLGRQFDPDGAISLMNISGAAPGTNRLRPKPTCVAYGT
jgi:hypothetical protein